MDLASHLTDPGLLGYLNNQAKLSGHWLNEFLDKIRKWKENPVWLSAYKIDFINHPLFDSDETEIWKPGSTLPTWANTTPSYILIAQNIINEGRSLSEMNWRDFENLIGALLENQGWKVEVTRGTKDGGIDVIAMKEDFLLGVVKTIWQAKKYSSSNLVSLSHVRELSAVREASNATKGIIVTTSKLTRGAMDWIKRDLYRLDYKEKKQIEEWILGQKLSL